MIDRIEAALGRDEDIVAEGDGRAVEKDAVIIDKEIVARAQVEAVIDADILLDNGIFAKPAEQFAQDLLAP